MTPQAEPQSQERPANNVATAGTSVANAIGPESEDFILANSTSHRAEYMQFLRLINNRKRMPPELLADYQEKKGDLFQLWFNNNKDIMRCVAYHKRTIGNSSRQRQLFGYKTWDDLLQMYHGRTDVAEEIFARRLAEGLSRRHPDAPLSDDMVQVWVMLDTTGAYDNTLTDEMVLEGSTEVHYFHQHCQSRCPFGTFAWASPSPPAQLLSLCCRCWWQLLLLLWLCLRHYGAVQDVEVE